MPCQKKKDKKEVAAEEETEVKTEKKETKAKKEKTTKKESSKKDAAATKTKKVSKKGAPAKGKKTEGKKETKKVAKKETKKVSKKSEAKKETKKVAKKETKKSVKKESPKKEVKKVASKKIEFSAYAKYIAEAIASIETEEDHWVSDQKIRTYIYKYVEEVKKPELIKANVKKALAKLTEEKLLVLKGKSYRFAAAGKKSLRPETVPKRKAIREIPTKPVEEPEQMTKSVVVTTSGRVSTKRY